MAIDATERTASAVVTARAPDGTAQVLLTLKPPPMETFVGELPVTACWADLRVERLDEIEVQRSEILAFFGALDRLDPARTPVTLALIEAAEAALEALTHQIKLALDLPRPVDLCPEIHPVIATPSHGSFPSGHAAAAYLVAALLTRIVDGAAHGPNAEDLLSARFRLAARIAVNRMVAGVHYPVDSYAGAALGLAMADWLAARAGAGVAVSRALDGDAYAAPSSAGSARDFHHGALRDLVKDHPKVGLAAGSPLSAPVDPLLEALFERAGQEWR
jgi:membrane-associated phospholipid phosphatase